MAKMCGIDVVLVGREAPGEENLGVRYVASALRHEGHDVRVVPLPGPHAIGPAAREILQLAPPLVGLAISDPAAALDHLVLAHLLRKSKFAGHITAGGALATLARHELLARHPELDSVVRHEGEGPATELARRLAEGLAWERTPGLTTRDGGVLRVSFSARWRSGQTSPTTRT